MLCCLVNSVRVAIRLAGLHEFESCSGRGKSIILILGILEWNRSGRPSSAVGNDNSRSFLTPGLNLNSFLSKFQIHQPIVGGPNQLRIFNQCKLPSDSPPQNTIIIIISSASRVRQGGEARQAGLVSMMFMVLRNRRRSFPTLHCA